jgi:hypothetical protein
LSEADAPFSHEFRIDADACAGRAAP